MKIEHLGELTQDPHIPEWLVSTEIAIPYFDGMAMSFILEDIADDASPEDFATAAGNFLALTAEHRQQATPQVYDNYLEVKRVCRMYDWDIPEIDIKDIWSHVYPQEIILNRGYDDQRIDLRITAGCDWEQEHGLQLVYRDGRELYDVSEIG